MIKPLQPSENNTTFWNLRNSNSVCQKVLRCAKLQTRSRDTVKLALVIEKFKISNRTMRTKKLELSFNRTARRVMMTIPFKRESLPLKNSFGSWQKHTTAHASGNTCAQGKVIPCSTHPLFQLKRVKHKLENSVDMHI